MTRILVCFLILASFFAAPARAQNMTSADSRFDELRLMETVVVTQVIDPLRVQLTDGRIVQLAGIDLPDFDPYDPGDLSLAARDMMKELLVNKQVRLYQTKDANKGRSNRMGYHLAHLVRSEDVAWIQGALLHDGLARVRPSERNPEMAAAMIAQEDAARLQKKGLWADEARYSVLTPDTAAQGMNGWAVVQGTVEKVATVNNVVYLNFGADWRKDFTIGISSSVRRDMAKAGADAMALGGKTVRIHGWVRDYNGPYIDLIHPAWIEILGKDPS